MHNVAIYCEGQSWLCCPVTRSGNVVLNFIFQLLWPRLYWCFRAPILSLCVFFFSVTYLWLRHCATSRKVAGSIHKGVFVVILLVLIVGNLRIRRWGIFSLAQCLYQCNVEQMKRGDIQYKQWRAGAEPTGSVVITWAYFLVDYLVESGRSNGR